MHCGGGAHCGLGVPEIVVAGARGEGPAAARFYGDPTALLRVVGITGTNGKTTTAFLLRDVLEAAGLPTGLLGRVKRVLGGVEETVQRTTPEAIDLQAPSRGWPPRVTRRARWRSPRTRSSWGARSASASPAASSPT